MRMSASLDWACEPLPAAGAVAPDTGCWGFSTLNGWLCFGIVDDATFPTGIRHLGEPSSLQPGVPKMERETLWHIAKALSILLYKSFKDGVASYEASQK